MDKLIVGQNRPIVLEVSNDVKLSDINSMSAKLVSYGETLGEWSLDDVTIQDDKLILPIAESESLDWKSGRAVLDIKYLTDYVGFFEEIEYIIEDRHNKTSLVGEET